MTRRITLLLGATCVVLALLVLLTGCGADEASAPPRTTRPPDPAATATDSGDEAATEDGDGSALCDEAADAIAQMQSDLTTQPILEVTTTFLTRVEPHADGQLRDDIRLVLDATRMAADGEVPSAEMNAAATEASQRVPAELARRCPGIPTAGMP